MTGHRCKHIAIQWARRSLQTATLVLLIGLVMLSLYAHYRAARVMDDEQLLSGLKGFVLNQIHAWVDDSQNAEAFLDGYKGTLWSMRIAGVDLSDPLAAAEFTATSKTLYFPILLSIVIPLIVTLLLGKVFCSWICPAYLLFEITGKLRRVMRFAEIPPAEVNFSTMNKYVFLSIGLTVAALTAQPIFALIYPPAVISRILHAWIFGTAMTGMLVLIGLIILFELCVSPRWWCRTMCPGGALYGLLGWPRLWRIKLNSERCTACRLCEPVCESGLNPVLESDGIECDNCGSCIRHCPEKALYYTIGLPGGGTKESEKQE